MKIMMVIFILALILLNSSNSIKLTHSTNANSGSDKINDYITPIYKDSLSPQITNKNSYVNVNPLEIDSYNPQISQNSYYSYTNKNKPLNIIYNQKLYQYDLEAQEIPSYYHSKPGVYNKDDFAYYSPGKTYRDIPKPREVKFSTPVTIQPLENDVEDYSYTNTNTNTTTNSSTKNKSVNHLKSHKKLLNKNDQLSNKLNDKLKKLEKELYELLLSFDKRNNDDKIIAHQAVNENYPQAYYDPSIPDKEIKVKKLRKEIFDINRKLGKNNKNDVNEINSFFKTIDNKKLPKRINSVIQNVIKNEKKENEKEKNNKKILNGEFRKLDDIYKKREMDLAKAENEKNPFESFGSLKNGYSDQILDYIKSVSTSTKKKGESSENREKINGLSSGNSNDDDMEDDDDMENDDDIDEDD